MKIPFTKLFNKSKANKESDGRRKLELEVLENRILYSAAPVDSGPEGEAPIEEYAVDVAYENGAQSGAAEEPPSAESPEVSASDGSQEPTVIDLGESSASDSGSLDQQTLDATAVAAENLWKTRGLTAEQEAALGAISYQVGNLGDGSLGYSEGDVITLDIDAGGYGWFIDLTPAENEEFELDENGSLVGALPDSAYGVDLLTVILHEQGHVLGLGHEADGVMDDELGIGSRELPVDGQADGALPGSHDEGSFLNFDAGSIIEASDAAAVDLYGYSTAISGDLAIVGSRFDDDGGSNSGSAYIYQNISGVWTEVAKLTASDPALSDQFGFSVSIDGDQAVVGALFGDAGVNSTGAAYVFQRNAGGVDQWGEVAKLTASDAAPGDFFGFSVALSGDSVVVGAYQNDDGGSASGSAYVFDRNEGGADNWGEVAKLTAADAAGGDNLGYAVAISGDSVVVGARLDDDGGTDSGSAYVFERNVGGLNNFGQLTKLVASDAFGGDNFGVAIAIDGDTAVIGARQDDDGGPSTGSAYVFQRTGGAWAEVAKLTADDAAPGDHFGASVGVHGDEIVVGSVFDDDAGNSSGSAYVFSRDEGGSGNWGQVSKLVASDNAADDRFGQSVGIGSEGVIVGAYQNDNNGSNSGSAYIFAPVAGNLTNVGLDANNNLVVEGLAVTNNDITLVIEGANVRVSDANATLVAGAGAVEDNGDILISLVSITGAGGILVNTGDGNDTLTLDFSGGDFADPINYNGGNPTAGPGDSLVLTGGSFASAVYTFDNSNSGSIDLTGNQTITYIGLEPVIANINVADVTLNFEGGNESIVVRNAGIDQTYVDSSAGESLVMMNPTSSLNLNAGDGNDFIGIEGLGGGFTADLNIDGQIGNDQIDFRLSEINTGGGDVTASAEDIDVISTVNAAGGNIELNATGLSGPAISISSDLITNGSGNINVNGSSVDQRAVNISGSAVDLVVENGTIEIIGQSDLREGVLVNSNLTATGTGEIVIAGTGGVGSLGRGVIVAGAANIQTNDGDLQIIGVAGGTAVLVTGGAQVTTIGMGDLTFDGHTTGDFNGADGVQINTTASVISTVDGNINIVGVSNAVTTNSNDGIQHSGGTIESTGSGDISLTGSGAGATGDGVFVVGTGVVRGNGGDISIVGDSLNDDGVSILNQVTNTGAGNISIEGIGGPLTTDEGVVISSAGLVQVVDGNISIVGESASGEGVVLSGVTVEATGDGDVSLNGTSSGNDVGVAVRTATVRAVDGDINLTGNGGLQGVALVSGTAEVTGTGSISISGTGGTSAGVLTTEPFAELTTNGGSIAIDGDSVVLGGTIDAGAGTLFVSALDSITVTGDIDANSVTMIADSDGDSNGSGGAITIVSDATIGTSFGGVTLIADEDVALTGITTSGVVFARSRSGAVVDGGDTNSDVAGGRLVAEGANGVGELNNALDTSILNFEANGGTGGVFLDNNVGLTIGNVGSMNGVSADGAAVQITADGALTVNEEVNAAGGNVDLTGGNVGISGTGVNVRADVATSSDGEINITGTGGTGSFDRGVSVSGLSTMVAAEDGDITITGVSANDDGVSISSEITTSGAGNISIEGDGGTLPSEFGVIISGSLAKVNSVDGDISIEGVSEGDEGVYIVGGANVVSTGEGAITVEGSGEGLGPASSSGVFVSSAGTRIETAMGDLSIFGESELYFGTYITGEAIIKTNGSGTLEIEGSSNGDEGVLILGRAEVIADGDGSIEIRGTGNGNAAGTSHGVVVAVVGTKVEATGGTITIEGDSAKDVGVLVTSGGEVGNSGDGGIDLIGNGGTGAAADGVQIAGSGTTISTEDGDVHITGTSIGDDGVQSSGHIVSQNGDIEIQGAGTSAVGVGVAIVGTGSQVSSENGNVNLTGDSQLEDGVRVDVGASVNTTGNGNVAIDGTSSGSDVGDSGVVVIGEVATVDGDAIITGTAAYTGLAIANGGQVNVGGSGNLSLTGNGGYGRGLHLVNGASASTTDGDLSIAGSSTGLDGVDLEGAQVSTTGAGSIDIQGSTLVMNATASINSAVDAALDIDGDTTISTIIAIGNVSITSASGVIRDLDNATDVTAASVTFSGVIAPGVTQGILNVSGDIAFAEDSLFSLDLDGLTAGEGSGNHDQANVAGGVTISSGVGLTLNQTTTFSVGETITILNNDGTDFVNGTFAGLAEGSFVSSIGSGATSQVFQITYAGGDGNDVQLTAIANADTSVSLDGDTLVIRDELNNDTNDVYTISVVGNDLMITDPNQVLGNQITGAEQSSLSVIWVPLNLFTRIRIESLGGDDAINIEDLPGYIGGIDVDAGTGFDVINYDAVITLNGGEDVVFRSETIVLDDDSEINATDAAANSGNISLIAGRNISGDETKLTTQDGDITLEANVAGLESGNFTGISLEDDTLIQSTGAGNISLSGVGGDDKKSNKGIEIDDDTLISSVDGNIALQGVGGDGKKDSTGISIEDDSIIQATGLGSISLTGTGGEDGDSNMGIEIDDDVLISAVDGDIALQGVGGDGKKDNVGISIEDDSIIQATGFGSISLDGTGGTDGDSNTGIEIDDDILISVVDGNITLRGVGGDGKKDNVGILIEDDSTLQATGMGSISLDGIGGTDGDANTGIEIDDDILISVVGGNLTLQGVGGDGKKDNVGISLKDDSTIRATGIGSVSLIGTGGTDGKSNKGIEIDDDILISVVDGNLTLQGIGGDGKDDNTGISIEDDSTLRATGAGSISLSGTGGTDGDSNAGIEIDDDILISVVDGNLTLQGIGGDGKKDNAGILIEDDSTLNATGQGAISLTGTGGTDGNSNVGIGIDDDILISVADGDLTLQGIGGDGKDHNTGISIEDDSKLRATGLGSISLDGTGGTGKNSNKGIAIADDSVIETVYGSIDLLGTGGDATGKFNIGIEISGSTIGSLFGNVNVVAFGGNGDKFNHGLVVCGSDVFSDNGLLNLMGTAGTGNNSEDTIGV